PALHSFPTRRSSDLIEDISVRLGMGSGNTSFGSQKKGALSRVLQPRARAYPAREGCLDQNGGHGNARHARRRLSSSRFVRWGQRSEEHTSELQSLAY